MNNMKHICYVVTSRGHYSKFSDGHKCMTCIVKQQDTSRFYGLYAVYDITLAQCETRRHSIPYITTARQQRQTT